MNCKNCNAEFNSKYCPNCGQAAHIKRIDAHYIIHEIEHVLHFDRGILYTIRELVTNPGQSIRNFLNWNRNKLVKPIVFIVITSLIYSIATKFFHVEDAYVNFDAGGPINKLPVTTAVFKWVQSHYGYANIMISVFVAFWLKQFFRKYKYNFFEILVLLCFVLGVGMLIYTIFGIIEGLIHVKVMQIAGVIGLAYTTWAIGHFFDKKKTISYLKAFVSYMLGMITAIVLTTAITLTIDLLIKH